jgi:hypothetical protein
LDIICQGFYAELKIIKMKDDRKIVSQFPWMKQPQRGRNSCVLLPPTPWLQDQAYRASRSDIERSLNFVSNNQNLKTEETVTSTMTAMDYPAQQVDYTKRYSATTCRTNHCNLGSKKSAILQKNLQIKAHHDRREHRAREPSNGNDFTE